MIIIWICWVQLNMPLNFNFISSFLMLLTRFLRNLNCKCGSHSCFVFYFYCTTSLKIFSFKPSPPCFRWSIYEMILVSRIAPSFLRSISENPHFQWTSGPFTNNHLLLTIARAKPWAFLQNLFFLLISFINLLCYFLIVAVTNYHKPGLKWHKFTSLQFCRPEV